MVVGRLRILTTLFTNVLTIGMVRLHDLAPRILNSYFFVSDALR